MSRGRELEAGGGAEGRCKGSEEAKVLRRTRGTLRQPVLENCGTGRS